MQSLQPHADRVKVVRSPLLSTVSRDAPDCGRHESPSAPGCSSARKHCEVHELCPQPTCQNAATCGQIEFTHPTRLGRPDAGFDVYVVQADGTFNTRLTSAPGWQFEPTWPPDGKQIAYTAYANETSDVYVMNADGSNQHDITNSPARAGGTSAGSATQRGQPEASRQSRLGVSDVLYLAWLPALGAVAVASRSGVGGSSSRERGRPSRAARRPASARSKRARRPPRPQRRAGPSSSLPVVVPAKGDAGVGIAL